jgi:hypothetical protein
LELQQKKKCEIEREIESRGDEPVEAELSEEEESNASATAAAREREHSGGRTGVLIRVPNPNYSPKQTITIKSELHIAEIVCHHLGTNSFLLIDWWSFAKFLNCGEKLLVAIQTKINDMHFFI